MKYIDTFINRITMYRLLLYYLLAIIAAAMVFGALGSLSYSPYAIVISTSLFVGLCYGFNYLFAWIYGAPTNWESSVITGLILSLIITPAASVKGIPFIIAAAGLAIASKYILAFRGKHIFNPAAIAVVLTSLGPQESASWWVGSTLLLPIVVVGGLLIVHKIRRGAMVATFIGVALVSSMVVAALTGHDIVSTIQTVFLRSSLFFLAFVMLTEPWTSPGTHRGRFIYATIVGLLFSPFIHIGTIYSTPEIALSIANIAAFFLSPIVKTKLHFVGRKQYGSSEDIEFKPDYSFDYKPGQYIEMTLPHSGADSRGLRRYFTLASSPTESTVRFGVRYYGNGSSFKSLLQKLDTSTPLSIGQLGGDFTMPHGASQKLAFIAGGIGITPFRSMIKYLSDTQDPRAVALLYGERSAQDVIYSDVFENARKTINVETTYVLSSPVSTPSPYVVTGKIDSELIKQRLPDYKERLFYISGPQPMVLAVKKELRSIGVPSRNIKVDYFFGYA